ncbi:HNH/ENDO VII family nuclease [Clostridium estertheticum]|uniref:GH-E family nuclease n=1 Tax=Clostridium estertheticum TaxID=238834 RepID=UPI001CF359DE|nr:GH-E family nuclease [Clostridium estertheticum]MCB2309241.1 HNH/ENDO VII family nuclease [Clostridium estertheticum]
MATFGAGAVIGAALIGAALGAACNVGRTIASDIKNNKMSSPLDYLISAAKGALVGALCGAIFGPAMAGTSLFAAETTGQLALNFAKTLFIGGAENSTYYALNELANFRMPNLGEELNQFKNGVLFTGLFMGGAKVLETAAPWIKKGASKVMDNIEKNVNKFGKYIDDLVPAKAVTPDGKIVYIKNDPIKSGGGGKKVELNKQQKDYNKAVEESKNAKGDKVVSEANASLYKRGSFRKSERTKAKKNAPININGEMICPTCAEVIPDTIIQNTIKGPRKRVGYDLDHFPQTWAERVEVLKQKDIPPTRKDVLDEYNRDIRVQCPDCNQGHKFEGIEGAYKGVEKKND